MEVPDYALFADWLTIQACDANSGRQGLIMNGDNMAAIMDYHGRTLLSGPLGATYEGNTYREIASPPDNGYCVRLEAPSVGEFRYGTENSTGDYEYDAWGNSCPYEYSFDVLGTRGSGVGNRAYVNVQSGDETFYSQIVNESGAGADNYRTVLDGVSWHHLSARDAVEECVGDSAHIVTAATNEIRAALEWIFGVGAIPGLCEAPSCDPTNTPEFEVGDEAAVTRLFQNSPNPFNPYTTLRFSLAAAGPTELSIYDVSGRRVRTLIRGELEAGSHEVVWDGTNEAGETLSSGVYWSQFDGAGVRSNKKMILLSNE